MKVSLPLLLTFLFPIIFEILLSFSFSFTKIENGFRKPVSINPSDSISFFLHISGISLNSQLDTTIIDKVAHTFNTDDIYISGFSPNELDNPDTMNLLGSPYIGTHVNSFNRIIQNGHTPVFELSYFMSSNISKNLHVISFSPINSSTPYNPQLVGSPQLPSTRTHKLSQLIHDSSHESHSREFTSIISPVPSENLPLSKSLFKCPNKIPKIFFTSSPSISSPIIHRLAQSQCAFECVIPSYSRSWVNKKGMIKALPHRWGGLLTIDSNSLVYSPLDLNDDFLYALTSPPPMDQILASSKFDVYTPEDFDIRLVIDYINKSLTLQYRIDGVYGGKLTKEKAFDRYAIYSAKGHAKPGIHTLEIEGDVTIFRKIFVGDGKPSSMTINEWGIRYAEGYTMTLILIPIVISITLIRLFGFGHFIWNQGLMIFAIVVFVVPYQQKMKLNKEIKTGNLFTFSISLGLRPMLNYCKFLLFNIGFLNGIIFSKNYFQHAILAVMSVASLLFVIPKDIDILNSPAYIIISAGTILFVLLSLFKKYPKEKLKTQ